WHGRQQHTTKGVAQCMTVATLERLHHHFGVEGRRTLDIDNARFQESIALHANSSRRNSDGYRPGSWQSALRLLRLNLDDQPLVDVLAELGAIGRSLECARHLLHVDFDP